MAKKKGGKKRAGPAPKPTPAPTKNDTVKAPEPEAASERSASKAAEPAPRDAESKPAAPKKAAAAAPKPAEEPERLEEAPHEEPPPPASAFEEEITAAREAEEEKARGSHPSPHPHGAAWARPFVVFERRWAWFEKRLLVVVLAALVASMVFWVALKGMSLPMESESAGGVVFRALFGASLLGFAARLATKPLGWDEPRRAVATIAAIAIGVVVAPSWRSFGVDYFGNILNWLQEGSNLTMFGGLRGLSTRLTILLALVGASLAAAGGKHINIDVALRFIKPALRVPVYFLSTVATAGVCFAAAWGFFDYTSIESFGAERDWSRSKKVEHVSHHVSQGFFLFRKQVGLDLSAVPHVLGGGKWDDDSRMNGRQWNEFVEKSGYRDYYTKEQVDAARAPDSDLDAPRMAMVVVPDGSVRGNLVHVMNLMFPVGFIILGLRFLLRLLMVVSGHTTVEAEPEFGSNDDEVPPEDDAAVEEAAR